MNNTNNMINGVPEDQTCPATGYQRVGVCVPVVVAPFAKTGPTKTRCCGDPIVIAGEKPCLGKKNGTCTFTITQVICVEVPVDFGAVATVGDTFVDCINASGEDICTGCTREDS